MVNAFLVHSNIIILNYTIYILKILLYFTTDTTTYKQTDRVTYRDALHLKIIKIMKIIKILKIIEIINL